MELDKDLQARQEARDLAAQAEKAQHKADKHHDPHIVDLFLGLHCYAPRFWFCAQSWYYHTTFYQPMQP